MRSPVPTGKTSGSKMMSSGSTPYFSVSSLNERSAICELALARDRLRLLLVLVDTADHQRRAVAARERHHALEALFAVFEVDRIDDRLARRALERLFDHATASVESIISGTLTFLTSDFEKAR